MKSIVVGIADTETSRAAARQAVEIAKALGASVHFVSAVESDHAVIEVGSDRFELDSMEAARTLVDRFMKSLESDVSYTIDVVEGPPAKALVAEAERREADLIVVGNVRMQGIGRVLGSVGNDVAHNAPCSVLIVKTV